MSTTQQPHAITLRFLAQPSTVNFGGIRFVATPRIETESLSLGNYGF